MTASAAIRFDLRRAPESRVSEAEQYALCVEMSLYVLLTVYGVLVWRWLALLPGVRPMALDAALPAALAAGSWGPSTGSRSGWSSRS